MSEYIARFISVILFEAKRKRGFSGHTRECAKAIDRLINFEKSAKEMLINMREK